MSEPVWLSAELAIAIHEMQLAEHGGPAGIRDIGALESELGRPKNKFAYGETDLAVLAAAYGFGMARNHPFADGNKRTALLVVYTFLGVNDVDFIVPEADFAAIIIDLAAGHVSEESLARWIRDHWPTPPSR